VCSRRCTNPLLPYLYLTYRYASLLRHYVCHRRSGLATSVWISHTCRQYARIIVTCDLDLDPMSDLHAQFDYSVDVPAYQKYYYAAFTGGNKVSRSIGIQKSQFFGFCDLELDPMAFKR